MPTTEKNSVKKIADFCLVMTIIVFLLGVGFLVYKFSGMKALYDERAAYELSDEMYASLTEAIKSEDQKIGYISMFIVALVLISAVVFFVFSRISSYQAKMKMYDTAYVDEVTGLPTKAKHRMDLEAVFEKKRGKYAYVSFEIDNFKYLNEMYGYAFGNDVLRFVADEISKNLKSDELLARTGGSHFGMLLHYESDELLDARLRDWFSKMARMQSKGRASIYNLQFTCGVYRIYEDSTSATKARENANIARESAPHLCDNSIYYFNEELQRKQTAKAELEFEMHSAFEQHQFEVYLQPKYSTDDENIVGAEALIRWNHPKKGLIFPNEFIPLFESNGFIVKIDYFVLEEVCKCIRKWLDDGIQPVVVSVNLSRIHLYDSELVNKVIETVDSFGIPHHYIEFELTETVLFDELGYLLDVMHKLKDAGFILSMDDFGSGYSSLNLLKKLPVDVLKLDKGFMDNFQNSEPDSKDRSIISHVISMAKDLDMEVLAEGVETENQKRFLQDSDCDMIQGYYYSKPVKLEEFDASYRQKLSAKSQ